LLVRKKFLGGLEGKPLTSLGKGKGDGDSPLNSEGKGGGKLKFLGATSSLERKKGIYTERPSHNPSAGGGKERNLWEERERERMFTA